MISWSVSSSSTFSISSSVSSMSSAFCSLRDSMMSPMNFMPWVRTEAISVGFPLPAARDWMALSMATSSGYGVIYAYI